MSHLLLSDVPGVETGTQFATRRQASVDAGFGPVVVSSALMPVLPMGGLERGHIYGCTGDAAMSLLFALAAQATSLGSWLTLINTPHAGLVSAAEHGVALHRTICVQTEKSSPTLSLVIGAFVDGVDLVVVSSPSCTVSEARRIAARVKAQGSILFVLGSPGSFIVDASFHTTTVDWAFDTHARSRVIRVQSSGRRVHGKRGCTVQLPNIAGAVQEVAT